jgi:hypothetical protein
MENGGIQTKILLLEYFDEHQEIRTRERSAMSWKPHCVARECLYEARRADRVGTHTHHRRRALAAVSATLIVALASLPTASALASSGSTLPGDAGTAKLQAPAVNRLVTPGQLLSAEELQSLLAALPLNDLSPAQLAHYLTTLEGVSVLAELKPELLSSKKLGVAGLEESLREAIEQLGPNAKLGELAKVEDFLPALEAALEGKLDGLLSALLGTLGAEAELHSALGSLSLEQLVGWLLGSTTPDEPLAGELSGLAGGLFGELGAEHKLEGLFGGSELVGDFAPKSVKEVAEELNTTPVAVSKELGQTATLLPESTTMLTAPLKDGQLAGVAPAAKGLLTGVLGDLGEAPEGEGEGKGGSGKGGSGEGTGSGEGKGSGSGEGGKGGGGAGEGKGSGGNGGSGSGGSGGQTTVLFTMPGTSSTPSAAAKQKVGKVSILSHRVRGHVATIVLRVPSAGTATLTGERVRGASRQAARAERLTLRVGLSRAAAASLHHRNRLAVELHASFRPTSGSSSATTVTVIFR